jgi:KDO2-lipid IV(A) lauroyltransferase
MRCLPSTIAFGIGRFAGTWAYYFDLKHKTVARANLRTAFARSKPPAEIKAITKKLFQNYGQNFIDLFRMPLITPGNFDRLITVEGKEHIEECLKDGKGAIVLAMHFGSWELASLSCAMMGLPYKVMVKAQTKYSRLDELLNWHRSCGGFVVLSRGMGTRDFVRSLKNNEVIGMVVDQGGRDGVLAPFFGRSASMSVGAIRMGLKGGVPICLSAIHREKDSRHRMVIRKRLELVMTGDMERDIQSNLAKVAKIMEEYIRRYPSEYMWFYKIWKYSDEANITILDDGRTGHSRQSQAVAAALQKALAERRIKSRVDAVPVAFKSKPLSRLFSVLACALHPFVYQGRLEFLKKFLTEESYGRVMKIKTDFIVSCGSSAAGVNNLLSRDHNAKSIVVLKPGILNCRRFDLVILPQHETPPGESKDVHVAITKAAPNLVTPEYQEEQKEQLLKQYSHLKGNLRLKIGLFIGGDSKNILLTEQQIKTLVHQITEAAREINADILATTSRRTPPAIEQMLQKRLRTHAHCPLLILAGRDEVPSAVGGILGLSDINVVSGDSISMISEAASSGKDTIVFTPEVKDPSSRGESKHEQFIERLNAQGFIFSTDVKDIGHAIYNVAKNKIRTRKLDDHQTILDAVRKVI